MRNYTYNEQPKFISGQNGSNNLPEYDYKTNYSKTSSPLYSLKESTISHNQPKIENNFFKTNLPNNLSGKNFTPINSSKDLINSNTFINSSSNPVTNLIYNSVVDSFSNNNPLINLHSSFPSWISLLKYYFNVSHIYVFYRVFFLVFPYYHIVMMSKFNFNFDEHSSNLLSFNPNYQFNNNQYDDHYSKNQHNYNNQYSNNQYGNNSNYSINKVDYYIPLMAFITYILLFGLTKGTTNEFQPDLLGRQATIASTFIIFEIIVIKGTFYIIGPTNISSFNLVAFSAYKFVHLVMICSSGLLLKVCSKHFFKSINIKEKYLIAQDLQDENRFFVIIFWCFFFYFAMSSAVEIAFFLIMDSKIDSEYKEFSNNDSSKLRKRNFSSLLFALAQFPICWFLTPKFIF